MAVLYRKYRPSSFDEVSGQEHVIRTLKNSIEKGRVAHAYLFSGPRGIGKTTIARILAKTINCKNPKKGNPCNQCEICQSINQNRFFDMVEIDAATYTKVESMRDIIEKINFAPAVGKYKVYIIDEVHMLSKSAFNALLKTLEEPPRHVVFILATTEVHKIPATIISRCQKFDFRRLKISEIKERLKKIAELENVKVEESVFDFIAIVSNGGARDSESLFGQILSVEGDNITLAMVQNILAITDVTKTIEMINMMLEGKYGEAIEYINKVNDEGYDLEQFAKSVIEYSRKLMLLKISPQIKKKFLSEMTSEQIAALEEIAKNSNIGQLMKIIKEFIQAKENMKSAILPQLPLELAVAEIDISLGALTDDIRNVYNEKIGNVAQEKSKDAVSENKEKKTIGSSIEKLQDIVKKSIGFDKEKKEIAAEKNFIEEKVDESTPKETEVGGEEVLDIEKIRNEWREILEEVKPKNHSLTAFLKTCQPVSVEKDHIIISCKYSFHKDKLQKVSNKIIIENVASEVLKSKVFIKFISQEDAEKMGYKIEKIAPNKKNNEDLVASALEMFGGEVV